MEVTPRECVADGRRGVRGLSVARKIYSVMAQFGRFFRASGGRAVRLANGAKAAIDAVLNRGPASISFEDLRDRRHYPHPDYNPI